MRWFTTSKNGTRFGPCNLAELNLLVQEGHLGQDDLIEEEGTGQSLYASAIPGLQFKAHKGLGWLLPSPVVLIPVGALILVVAIIACFLFINRN